MAVFYLVLIVASLLLVHSQYYEPAVSYVLLYLVVSVTVTAAIAVILLPAEQFSGGFTGGMCAVFAACVAMMVFFSGGLSSELYLLFLPLLSVAALHGSTRIGLVTLASVLFFYTLAIIPGLLDEGVGTTGLAPLVFYRLGVLSLVGVFILFSTWGTARASDREDQLPGGDESGDLARRVEKEIQAKRGVQVAVVLVDPGRDVEDVDLLLERVRARISDPVLLDEGVFGFVLSGTGDREAEGAARRAIAAAGSLGATETRAGAAIYPRDARSANDLLVAAGRALEAAFEVDSPSAIVLSGRDTPRERHYRAAR